ncbi:MAG: AAA family ATPase [Rhodocyclaceae bacterium]|nr:AAA family ATPase [Rhodocyclaceae bacterium]
MTAPLAERRLTTGIAGLDQITQGGLPAHGSYLVRGGPGAGKSTLGLHFLAAGAAAGERCLYVTLEESEARIRAQAARRHIDLSRVTILDISPSSSFFAEAQSYDIFSPAEVEREPITRRIIEQVETLKPQRVFLDPMTQFRYLSSDVFQFRRQMVSFLRYLLEHDATVLFTSECSAVIADDDLQFMSDGVIDIVSNGRSRTVEIRKLRGSDYQPGCHALRLDENGMAVYPRLLPNVPSADCHFDTLSSGLAALDALLGGGLERGTVTVLSGPSGVGKTTLGMQFMQEAARRGERSVIYGFEEAPELTLRRCDGINLPARAMVASGALSIRKIEPLQYSADEFDALVRADIEERGARIIMIDSVTGYELCLRGEALRSRIHAIAKFAQNLGVAVLIVNELETIAGDFRATENRLSYLADNLLFLRFLEIDGEIRKAIGVLKKRLSDYERTLREFAITAQGIVVGKPLSGLRGILKGAPEFSTPPPR